MTRRVAIVGAGAAGLLAAHRARALGASVTVFEAAARVGGQLQTAVREGWQFETGAFAIGEPHADVVTILEAAGLWPRIVRSAPGTRRRYVVQHGIPQPIPASLGELIASPILSLGGRMRMAREPFVRDPAADAEETVDQFARRRFGEEVAERLFDPLVAEISGGDARKTIARYLFPSLVEFEQSAGSVLKGQVRAGMQARRRARGRPTGAWTLPGGVGAVAEQLASTDGITVRCDAAVSAITAQPGGVELQVGGAMEQCDGAIVTVPPPALTAITWGGVPLAALAALRDFPMAAVSSIALGFRRDAVAHPLDGLSIRFPSAEDGPLLSVFVPGLAFPGREPAGSVLLIALAGGNRAPGFACQEPEVQSTAVLAQLRPLLGLRGDPVLDVVTTWADGLPQAVAGHGERLAQADAIERASPRLALTGAWRDGIAVADAMLGGVRAAERLMERLRTTAP